MLRITIELLPGGKEEGKTVLGTVTIALQEMSSAGTRGRYKAQFRGKGGQVLWDPIEIRDFPRRQRLAWDLLYRALHVAVGDRNNHD